ncbi:MAG: hypothetical protein J7M01_03485 [Candidatus Marinimicrobia bacterium]|nr:hypothetical protein [Candidatus Neomarinimicrobiota bacterium]
MDYQVVYNAAESDTSAMSLASNLLSLSIPVIILLACVGILIYVIRGRSRVQLKGLTFLVFPIILTLFAAFMTFLTVSSFFISKDNTSEIIDNEDYKVVEGIIENFDRMPYGGHKDESFTVNGVYFAYSDYGSYAGVNSFNQTASHGGPIRENGQQVRLTYITWGEDTNLIVKVEIAND